MKAYKYLVLEDVVWGIEQRDSKPLQACVALAGRTPHGAFLKLTFVPAAQTFGTRRDLWDSVDPERLGVQRDARS